MPKERGLVAREGVIRFLSETAVYAQKKARPEAALYLMETVDELLEKDLPKLLSEEEQKLLTEKERREFDKNIPL